MALAQQYSDSLPEYPPECSPLQDLGFKILPWVQVHWDTQTWWENIADVWISASYGLFFVLLIFACRDSVLMLTRFFWCLSYAFAIRTLIVLATRYPRVPFKSTPNYHADNIIWGALLILLGVRTTSTDMMFSAHTCGWVMTAWFIWHYSKTLWVTLPYLLFNVTGIILLLCVREHYTADVLVAIFLALLIPLVYHLLLDDEMHMAFGSTLTLHHVQPNVDLLLPLKVTDARGNTLTNFVIDNAQLANNTRTAFIRTGRGKRWGLTRLMNLLVWLDRGIKTDK